MWGTTQATQQLSHTASQAAAPRTLSHFHLGLYDCLSSCKLCCYGLLCPCVLYGDTHNRLHGMSFWSRCCMRLLCPCFTCIYAAGTRRTVSESGTDASAWWRAGEGGGRGVQGGRGYLMTVGILDLAHLGGLGAPATVCAYACMHFGLCCI